MLKKGIAVFTALFLTVSANLYAAEEESHESHAEEHKNHIGLFLGATSSLEAHSTTVFTAGLDYERRLSKLFGIGLLFDFPIDFAQYNFAMIAAPTLNLHPFGGLKITVAPGIEYAHDKVEFLIRGGLGYDIHIGKYTLTPTVSFDYVAGHTSVVYGAAIGRGF